MTAREGARSRRRAQAALTCGLVLALAASAGSWSAGRQPAQAEPDLTVPAGFTVEKVAGPPLVDRPIVADFDDEGRLYVADSSGSNDKVEQQLAERPHRIVRLEDIDGDGRFDKRVVFADRMMFPEGAMWFDGSLYVAAPPSIWKLTDTDGDGVADRREEWFQGKTLTGCANDLHGPYLGPDGMIYWTKGAFAQQTYEREGAPPLVTRASHIFRRRPGDIAIEPVMTGGMDNPVDVAFTPTGDRLFTATFLEHPQLGKRDAIVHAIYGGVYGKLHAVLDGHKRTGDLMPVTEQLGPAVPSGLTRYASRVFGDAYRDTFFATMFNLRKVTHHALEPDGATFKLRSSDFLVSSSRDFHPTDVVEDADGSLLVIDTGPWYKLCCPTSQLAKPDLPGAIYRVRRVGARPVQDPRGRRLPWASMQPAGVAALLGDSRPAVVARALHQAGTLGAAAIPALETELARAKFAAVRQNAVWALTRVAAPRARAAVRRALRDHDSGVRLAALHSVALWRDREAVPRLVEILNAHAPAEQRAAAEALGRARDPGAIPHLVAAASRAGDRILEHSLTYALIEIGDPVMTRRHATEAADSRSRRAALIALDQMDGGGLEPGSVIPLLDSTDGVLRDTAWWIAGHHAQDWGNALSEYFRSRLVTPARELQEKLAQFASSTAIQDLLATTIEQPASVAARQAALSAMASARGRFKQLPPSWLPALARVLADGNEAELRLAVAAARAAPSPKDGAGTLHAALLRLAADPSRPLDVRLDALTAVQDALTTADAAVFELLRASLGPGQPPLLRAAAAGILERLSLDRAQLLALAERVAEAGPLELPRLLRPFEHAPDEAVGEALLGALERSGSRAAVRADQLRLVLAKYPPAIRERGERLAASILADSSRQAERLQQLLASLGPGDVRRGQEVFNSTKAACYSCHAIGYMGGRIGPDLTRIGQVRTERDLLEAIVFPSASFARSYEPFTVTTSAGRVHSGMLRAESADEIVLGTATGEDVRISRREIAAMEPGTVSLMPAGLDEQLTRQELADLLAFLKATRPGAQ